MIVAQLVKNLPAMWEIWVQSLGWEDPLEKGVATYFQYSGLENSMDHIVHGSQRIGHDWVTFTSLTMITSIFRSLLPFCFFLIIFFYATFFFFPIFLEQCWIFILHYWFGSFIFQLYWFFYCYSILLVILKILIHT